MTLLDWPPHNGQFLFSLRSIKKHCLLFSLGKRILLASLAHAITMAYNEIRSSHKALYRNYAKRCFLKHRTKSRDDLTFTDQCATYCMKGGGKCCRKRPQCPSVKTVRRNPVHEKGMNIIWFLRPTNNLSKLLQKIYFLKF